jgi:uncharacterized protein (TIGR03437 family)
MSSQSLRLTALIAVLFLAAVSLSVYPLHSQGAVFAAFRNAAGFTEQKPKSGITAPATKRIRQYGALPLHFEANRGQTDRRVDFLARGRGYTILLTGDETLIRLQSQGLGTQGILLTREAAGAPESAPAIREATLRMKLEGASGTPKATGVGELSGKSNYLIGSDPKAWRTGATHYSRVEYKDVYRGVDMVYYGNQQELEYDFIVGPDGDPRRIRFEISGADTVRIDENGELVLQTGLGDLRGRAPVVYQQIDGARREVLGRYRLLTGNRVGFEVGPYNKKHPLVIDPVLVYSTPLGGLSTDVGFSIAVDSEGAAYLTGYTASTALGTPGVVQPQPGGNIDAFVFKMNPAGTGLVYATYLGGESTELGNGIAVDAGGNAYVTGYSFSSNFPTTPGALLRTRPGVSSAFVSKLNPTGSALTYSTFLGGDGLTTGIGIGVDANGSAAISGTTDATNIPIAGLTNVRGGNAVQKSGDQGANWAPSAAGLSPSTVSGIVVAPSDQNIIYAATNYGVHKSLDGGATWRPTGAADSAIRSTTIRSLVVHPTDPNTIYVLSNVFGVIKSVDGGVNYTLQNTGLSGVFTFNSLAISPTQPETLLLGVYGGVFKTTNGGATWTAANGGFPQLQVDARLVAFDPINPMIAYTSASFIFYKTTNGGTTWVRSDTGMGSTSITSLVIDPTAPSTLIAGASSYSSNKPITLFKSVDGGANWSDSGNGFSVVVEGKTTPLFPAALAMDPFHPTVIYTAASGLGVYKSVDGGDNWTAAENKGLTNKGILTLAIDRRTPSNLFIGANIGTDAFLAKLKPDGAALEFFRHLAGSELDSAFDLDVDAAGNTYFAGYTNSPDFPTTNPFQSQRASATDAIVGKLNPDGSVAFLSYLGGNSTDNAYGVTYDPAGNLYVVGGTFSTNFPTLNPVQGAPASVYRKAFIAKVRVDGSALEYSTYLGGARTENAEGVVVDAGGSAYVVGTTDSADFPTAGAPQKENGGYTDAFIVKLSPSGSTLDYSTFLGGADDDNGFAIARDARGDIYVTGVTRSFNFPMVNPFQTQVRGTDTFLTKLGLQADLSLSMEDSSDPVMVNNELTYTLTIANAGPDTTAAIVTDILPPDLTLVSATSSTGACTGTGTLTCNLNAMPAGSAATVKIIVKSATVGATLTNRASVVAAIPDPVVANNTAEQTTRVSASPSLAGRIALASGVPVSGVDVNLTGTLTSSVKTGADGRYQLAEVQAGGNFTVTPVLAGYAFRPPSREYNNVTSDQIGDFTAIGCRFTIAPRNQSFLAAGGAGEITITAPDSQCGRSARTTAPWIELVSPASGSGNGTLRFNVSPAQAGRSAVIMVAGHIFTIWQAANSCGVPGFNLPRQINAGVTGPVATGDFNRDGKLDLVVAGDRRLSTLLNQGSVGLGAPVVTQIQQLDRPQGALVEDFNKDGNPDVAIAFLAGTNNVLVLIGDGAGGFSAPTFYSAGASPSGLTSGDFNKDGNTDLAVVNNGSSNVSILPGLGNGGFSAGTTVGGFTVLSYPLGIDDADFNGDGNLDLAITSSDKVVIFSGDGRGGFGGTPTNIAAGRSPQALLSRDFNGDGKPDLALTNAVNGRSNLAVALNQGAGTFTAWVNYPIAGSPPSGTISISDRLDAGDLNGDAKIDLIVWGWTAPIQTFLGDGAGNFSPARSWWTPGYVSHVKSGDFNDDGKSDLAVSLANNQLSVIHGLGDGAFESPASYPTPNGSPIISRRRMLAADLNGDGNPDIASIYPRPSTSNGLLGVRFGDGTGRLGDLIEYEVEKSPYTITSGDLDNDGRADLAVTNEESNSVSILFGAAPGFLPRSLVVATIAQPRSIAIGDFTGDGVPDLAVGHRPELVGTSYRIRLSLIPGIGNGGFSPAVFGELPNVFESLSAADLNQDGRLDLVGSPATDYSGRDQGLAILLNNGPNSAAGLFRLAPRLKADGAQPVYVTGGVGPTIADLDGDGYLDIVFAPDRGKAIAVAMGDGTGVSWRIRVYPLGPTGSEFQFRTTEVADFNSDGRIDLLSASSEGGIEILLGDDAGNFRAPIPIPVGASPTPAVADFNRDGKADLAIARNQQNDLTLLLNSCLSSGSVFSVSAASFLGPTIAPDSIAAAFGAGFATTSESATSTPLPTELGGVQVLIRDSVNTVRIAPLFHVSPGQVNFLTPAGFPDGPATVTISNRNGAVSTGSIYISNIQPGLFTANADGQGPPAGVLLRASGGATTYEPIAQLDPATNKWVSRPINLGPATDRVYLILFGTGIRNRSQFTSVTVRAGAYTLPVEYAGRQNELAGLDQVNIPLPQSLAGLGEQELILTVGSVSSNPVRIRVQ